MSKWNGQGLPPVGEVCEFKKTNTSYRCEFVKVEVLFVSDQLVVLQHSASKNHFSVLIDDVEFRPLKSEAERKRDEAVEKLEKTLSVSRNYLTPKSSFVFKRVEELEQGTMCMSYNDGPAKGIIRDLYRVMDSEDGSKDLAEMLYDAGWRNTDD